MQKVFLVILSGFLLLVSCSKKNDVNATPVTGTISISGTVYPTVTIGNQVWTTQNYSGPGGDQALTIAGDVQNGNYYHSSEISLPDGWHVPTRQEFNTLLSNYSSVTNADGDVVCNLSILTGLISKTGWAIKGTNTSGFNAYATGSLTDTNTGSGPQNQGVMQYAEYLTTTTGLAGTETYVFRFSSTANTNDANASYTSVIPIETMPLGEVTYTSVRFVKNK
jgi:uncharacterized protein (TIGR02145 family)